MADTIHLLVNPRSKHGRPTRLVRVERLLRTQGYDVLTHRTSGPGDAESYAARLEPGSLLAVVGGDGTITEAARGAVRSDSLVIPLPGGRGNDLCRYFGVQLDLLDAVQALPTCRERRVDAGAIDDILFLGVATIGFDSIANDNANRSWLRGRIVYAAGALRALARWKPVLFRLVVDGEPRKVRGTSVVVGNTGRYGGGMKICPDAVADDGWLDLVIIGAGSRRELLRGLPEVFDGRHVRNPLVHTERVQRVRVEGVRGGRKAYRRRMAVFADGDRVMAPPFDITTLPGAVRLVVPVDRERVRWTEETGTAS